MQSEEFYNPEMNVIMQKLTPYFLREADIVIDPISGDFNIGETSDQDIDFILLGKKGNFFWEPLLGYDVNRLQNTKIDVVKETAFLIAELRKDGFNRVYDLLIGQTSDPNFVNGIKAEDRSSIPEDSLLINVNAERI